MSIGGNRQDLRSAAWQRKRSPKVKCLAFNFRESGWRSELARFEGLGCSAQHVVHGRSGWPACDQI